MRYMTTEDAPFWKISRHSTGDVVEYKYSDMGTRERGPADPRAQLGWLDERIARLKNFLGRLEGIREAVAKERYEGQEYRPTIVRPEGSPPQVGVPTYHKILYAEALVRCGHCFAAVPKADIPDHVAAAHPYAPQEVPRSVRDALGWK